MTQICSLQYHPDLCYDLYLGPYQGTDLPNTSSSTGDVAEFLDLADFVVPPGKNIWIDAVWLRDEGEQAGSAARVRLLRVSNGQTAAAAQTAAQWITDWLNFNTVTNNTLKSFVLSSSRGGRENHLNEGDRIAVLFDEPAPGMSDCVIGVRYRFWPVSRS